MGYPISGFAIGKLPRFFFLLTVYNIGIKGIYVKSIRVNLRAQRRQNACTFPDGLANPELSLIVRSRTAGDGKVHVSFV